MIHPFVRNTFLTLFLPILFIFSLFAAIPSNSAHAIFPDAVDPDAVGNEDLGNEDLGNEALVNEELEPSILSPRLIVELESPPLAVAQEHMVRAAGASAKLDVQAASAQAYLAQLQAEQSAFAAELALSLPEIKVSVILNESTEERLASYRVIFNGLAVNIGDMNRDEAEVALRQLAGVKAVHPDKPYMPLLYDSVAETRAPEAWNLPDIGGFDNAGRGIRIASIDSGVYGAADMFNGEGYSYPAEYPPNGYGDTENNTGKVIVSRAYFRDWDPPVNGEERGWPGSKGSSHGTHTASTAAGDLVTTTVPSVGIRSFSGVAPKAYVLSYKVNYGSQLDMPFFFTAELLMAMEDAISDGADIVNNSWGGGPGSIGGEFDAVDAGLINLARAGVFVSMSTGNSGPGTGTTDHPSPDYINVAAGRGTLSGGSLTGFITDFSSRGPGVGNVLKPDITAPGRDVYAQGYGCAGDCGLEKHEGYGAVSGTSMAAPHVSGAAGLLKQIHPDWSNAMIKSALMSTAQYTNIFLEEDGEIAQPLDMGAGWLNVAAATDPGIILDPPSVSFGLVGESSQQSQLFQLTNITGMTETYTVTTYYRPTKSQSAIALPGFTVEPLTMTVGPGDSASVTVTFDAATGSGLGDNQGYILLDGDQHKAHLATWARVAYDAPLADVLILDNDGSEADGVLFPNVTPAYTAVLDNLGYSYDIHVINKAGATPTTVPDAVVLSAYKAVIIVTGENGRANVPDTLIQMLTEPEMDQVVEYLNTGGAVIAMGENMGRIMLSNQTDDLRAPFLYRDVFRSNWIQDSVTKGQMPQALTVSSLVGPMVLFDLAVNVTSTSMDELDYRYHNGWPLTYGGTPILQNLDEGRVFFGIVGMMSRDQPSLATPGLTYPGRSIYTTFGLENVVDSATPIDGIQPTSRDDLLGGFLNLLWSEPATISISVTVPITTGQVHRLALDITGGQNQLGLPDSNALQFDEIIWDYGDGSDLQSTTSLASRTHQYYFCKRYRTRAATADRNGNVAVTSLDIDVSEFCVEPIQIYMPFWNNRR